MNELETQYAFNYQTEVATTTTSTCFIIAEMAVVAVVAAAGAQDAMS